VHLSDLTHEEKKMIIPQMMNYLEKYKPNKSFDKFKVRVLTRGDMQKYVGVVYPNRIDGMLYILIWVEWNPGIL
jgi:hypothetical protein